MQAVSAGFSFSWYYGDSGGTLAQDAYPGPSYVNSVSYDLYDQTWDGSCGLSFNNTATPAESECAWTNSMLPQLTGLAAFAAKQNKPIGFGEWGVISRSDGHGLGDDPTFIENFAAWINANNVAWTSYFDFNSGGDSILTDYPNSLATFIRTFSNPCAVYTGNDAFLCAAYEDLLGHKPDPSGLAYWIAALNSGVSRTQVAYDIGTSTAYRTNLVTSYYETFLGKAPDSTGLAYWVNALNDGASDQSVLASILGSAQFYSTFGKSTPNGFVIALYAMVLGAGSNSSGITYWVNALNSGTSRTQVAYDILASTECRTDFVGAQYLDLLDRVVDPAGLSYWVGQLAGGVSNESVIAALAGSSEFYTDAVTS